ncbi:hypothetical protein EIP86_003798 [Pleurotus ostreatoroseus]|nr:hypothetical protein EIP86_003798 [Pleurotus ostreatoroseus]
MPPSEDNTNTSEQPPAYEPEGNSRAPTPASDASSPRTRAAGPQPAPQASGATGAPGRNSRALPPQCPIVANSVLRHRPRTSIPSFPAMHSAIIPEPTLRGSAPIRVAPRCGVVGASDKVEWRLYATPPSRIASGMRVALCDEVGDYRYLSRTIGPIVGADRLWVTFALSNGLSAPATLQTLTVPRENAALPILLRIILFFLASYLANEHPLLSTPLPDLE